MYDQYELALAAETNFCDCRVRKWTNISYTTAKHLYVHRNGRILCNSAYTITTRILRLKFSPCNYVHTYKYGYNCTYSYYDLLHSCRYSRTSFTTSLLYTRQPVNLSICEIRVSKTIGGGFFFLPVQPTSPFGFSSCATQMAQTRFGQDIRVDNTCSTTYMYRITTYGIIIMYDCRCILSIQTVLQLRVNVYRVLSHPHLFYSKVRI